MLTAAALACAGPALALAADQTPADRADPSVAAEELGEEKPDRPRQRTVIEPPAQASGSDLGEPVLAGAIRIEGADAVPQAAFAPVVERYAGRTLAPDELRALASDVAAVAREAGFGLATAWIPPQRIENGVLRVQLDEGAVDAVEVTGTGRAAAEPRLAPLADGKPLRTSELERRLLIAGDAAGVSLGKARLIRNRGRNILVVAAARDRVTARAGLDNWGTSTSGPVRARLSADINGLAAADDRLTVGAVVTPLQPQEFALVRAAYTAAIGTDGTEITVGGYAARSEAGGPLADRDLDGKSTEIEADVRHPLVRTREASLWASAGTRLRDSSQTRADELVRDDRLTTLIASLYGYRRLENGRIRGRVALVQGVDLFGATDEGDPLASRRNADGQFTKLELWGEYEQRLGYNLSFLFQAEGQLASGALLSSEEMGLGGRWFGRAWDYREFSGDRGVAGAFELRWDWKKKMAFIEAAQLYGYVDAGTVSNFGTGTGGGSLASVGGGLRLWLPGRVMGSLEVGVPLTRGADADNDPRVSVTVDKRF
jgi:hemolysin activation/secretion protein